MSEWRSFLDSSSSARLLTPVAQSVRRKLHWDSGNARNHLKLEAFGVFYGNATVSTSPSSPPSQYYSFPLGPSALMNKGSFSIMNNSSPLLNNIRPLQSHKRRNTSSTERCLNRNPFTTLSPNAPLNETLISALSSGTDLKMQSTALSKVNGPFISILGIMIFAHLHIGQGLTPESSSKEFPALYIHPEQIKTAP